MHAPDGGLVCLLVRSAAIVRLVKVVVAARNDQYGRRVSACL